MKKYIALFLALVCVLGLVACSANKVDKAKPVFETENICKITLFAVPNHADGVVVPSEYMDEITAWIGTFTIDKEAGDILDPGTNTFSFRLEYSDGTIVESGVNTTTIDGITYYMKQERSPECFNALFTLNTDVEYDEAYAPTETRGAYTYEELSEMPGKELLDLFIQNGLVINDDLKASFTEEELQTLFKENFHLWHTGVSAHSHTMYCDLAEQTKEIFDKIAEPSTLSNDLPDNAGPGDVINNSNS